MRQNKMRIFSIWTAMVLLTSTAMASASTFQNVITDELYTEQNHPELYCLAQNVYFEAKSEPLAGQYAVADVVLNRVKDNRYPNTICEVVKEGPIKESWKTRQYADLPDEERIYYPKKNKCQFSWYCDGKADKIRDGDAWRQAQIVAYRITYNDRHRGLTEGATHYHADYVHPKWASTLQLVGRIATHIFYRWP
tara:strand:+ start:3012 stop:3593 length:582 start_codon:yes stop_codon:yes gene_type:complete